MLKINKYDSSLGKERTTKKTNNKLKFNSFMNNQTASKADIKCFSLTRSFISCNCDTFQIYNLLARLE